MSTLWIFPILLMISNGEERLSQSSLKQRMTLHLLLICEIVSSPFDQNNARNCYWPNWSWSTRRNSKRTAKSCLWMMLVPTFHHSAELGKKEANRDCCVGDCLHPVWHLSSPQYEAEPRTRERKRKEQLIHSFLFSLWIQLGLSLLGPLFLVFVRSEEGNLKGKRRRAKWACRLFLHPGTTITFFCDECL